VPDRCPSVPLVGELRRRSRIRGAIGGGHTKTARGPASEPSIEQRLGESVVPGSTRSLQFIGEVRPGAGSDPPLRGSPGDGGDEETRTPDPLLAKEMLCQLSYVPSPRARNVVGVSGLEPETSALSGQCSNQLS
jgi:hypothetical protein